MMYPFFYPDLQRPYSEIIDEMLTVAEAAEDLGFEGVAFPEHHFFNYMCTPSALNMASLVAGRTSRIKLITAVLVLPYYNPFALAEIVAQVDHASKGRLELGVARGANKYEFDRLGVRWQDSREMFEESLDLMIRAWTEENVGYEGGYWSSPPTTAIPKPYQKPYPKLWVSAQSKQGVMGAAARGLNMITSPNLGSFAPHGDIDQVMQWYSEGVAESAMPRGDVMVLRRVMIGATEEEALGHLDSIHQHWNYYMSQFKASSSSDQTRFNERTENEGIQVRDGAVVPAAMEIDRTDIFNTYDDPIVTSPEKAIQRFKHYEAIGVNHVLAMSSFGQDIGATVRSMELLASEVMPSFQ
jgi:alkanesulfonate monooxygenase SsuD/methylene tetrahydromethanopterin reductase-like flavin-dependent oxidoreductase (luciferase family)